MRRLAGLVFSSTSRNTYYECYAFAIEFARLVVANKKREDLPSALDLLLLAVKYSCGQTLKL